MNGEAVYNYTKKVKKYLNNTKLNDLSRLMQITGLENVGKGKALLIAGVVAWSAFFCSFGNVNSAAAASAGLLGKAGILTEGIRLAGVPYRNRNGKIFISNVLPVNNVAKSLLIKNALEPVI